ncbi:hypothetical protein, partial [Parabacteroides sp. ZJ-118]|uniref:hypothetical protein n=1 Tax=Parabacteroides sp. ZJ-118 TaxID=2709398 RepID=UPI00197D220D
LKAIVGFAFTLAVGFIDCSYVHGTKVGIVPTTAKSLGVLQRGVWNQNNLILTHRHSKNRIKPSKLKIV